MEKDNGRGIFYGVIGVATLVVAIIGATFAYFSATANSAEDAVTTGGAKVSLTWNEVNTGLKSNLIPLDPTQAGFSSIIGTAESNCKDKNGNNVCSVYQFTVSNPAGNAAQNIYVSLKPKTNTFTTSNLKFAVFKGEATSRTTYNVNGTAKATTAAADGDLVQAATSITNTTEIQLTNLNQLLDANGSATYTVVLWIDETGAEQNADQGKNFAGGIFVTTAQGENTGLTGVLTA